MLQEQPDTSSDLERRTVLAHREYLRAFLVWERAQEALRLGRMRPLSFKEYFADAERARVCSEAETEKEKCRRIFRDLTDELGYTPKHDSGPMPKAPAIRQRALLAKASKAAKAEHHSEA